MRSLTISAVAVLRSTALVLFDDASCKLDKACIIAVLLDFKQCGNGCLQYPLGAVEHACVHLGQEIPVVQGSTAVCCEFSLTRQNQTTIHSTCYKGEWYL